MIALIKSSDVISPATVMFLPQYVDFTGCTEVCRFLILFSFDEIYLKADSAATEQAKAIDNFFPSQSGSSKVSKSSINVRKEPTPSSSCEKLP